MPTAIDRPLENYTPGTASYHSMMRRRDPNYRIPEGFEWSDRLQQVVESHPYLRALNKISPYLVAAPAAGGLGFAAATGTGVFGGAGAAGAAGAGAGGAGTGAAGAGGAGAGAAGAGGATTIGGVTIPGFTGPEMIAPGITSTMAPSSFAAGGGGLLKWLSNPTNIFSAAGDIGSVLSGAARDTGDARYKEGLLQNQRDALRNQQFGTQQGAQFNLGALDLQRQAFSEGARGTRGKQAAIGNLLQNIQDVNLNVPGIAKGTISGGLRPSALGPGGRAAGGELARQAMLKLMTPDTFTGGEILTPPDLTPIPQSSGWEKAAGIGGILGNILGAVGSATRPRGTQPPPITSTVKPRQPRYPEE